MMDITYIDIIKIAIAFILGALLGLEREYHNKPAGLRTLIMITVGATVFTILSYRINSATPDRIAANIITGIGFIGAGVIFKERMKVGGLTTAATIWIAAAIGMAVGYGAYYLASGVSIVVLITLMIIAKLENSLFKLRQVRLYKISFLNDEYSKKQLEENFILLKIDFIKSKEIKTRDEIMLYYKISANKITYDSLNNFLMETKAILSFDV
ncbi:MAG: MgtC/SapB family protein [Ferruginibacter sp.]